jgi:hypothetical protein
MPKIIKNGNKIGKGNPPVDTRFTSEYQPTPEAKSKGWERRRMAREMMDIYDRYQHMSYKEFLDIKEDIKNNPQNYTVVEVDMFKYAKNPKFILDRINRHISNAPQQLDVDMGGNVIINIKEGIAKDDRPKS